MEISVAYQGGGAKLFELLPVITSLNDIEKNETDFRIFRVSGTSAGAIAAALHATNCDIRKIIESKALLEKFVLKRFGGMSNTSPFLISRILSGKSAYPESNLYDLIMHIFEIGGVDAEKAISDLTGNTELRILRSDIKNHKSYKDDEKSEQPLISSLVDSCAIPFVFRVPSKDRKNQLNTPFIVDGGLFQNLPIKAATEKLTPNQYALGFSFERNEASDFREPGVIKYTKNIVESLFTERVEDAAKLVGESNIIKLPNNIYMLGFDEVFSDDMESRFSAAEASVREKVYIWKAGLENLGGPDLFSSTDRDRLRHFEETERNIAKYAELVGTTNITAKSLHHHVNYRSCFDKMLPDIYEMRATLIGAENEGIQYFNFKFYDSETGSMKRSQVEVWDNRKSEKLSALVIPMKDPANHRVAQAFVILERPLTNEDDITILKTEESFDCMSAYTNNGVIAETLAIKANKSADEMTISVDFPKGSEPAHVRDTRSGKGVSKYETDKHIEEAGNQLKAISITSESLSGGGIRYVCKTTAKENSDERRYFQILFDKGRGS